jgi:hypothetical protein
MQQEIWNKAQGDSAALLALYEKIKVITCGNKVPKRLYSFAQMK